jgi:3-dehydroquinate synthetase
MIAASFISEDRAKIKRDTTLRITNLIKNARLPILFQPKLRTKIIHFLKHDKKVRQGKNRFVLVEQIGRVSFGNEILNKEVNKALEKMLITFKENS